MSGEIKIRTRMDVAKVMAKIERAEKNPLNVAGFMVMQEARKSIKKKRGKSAAGTPIHRHSKQNVTKIIRYKADWNAGTVVVGAEKRWKTARLHEHGGTQKVHTKVGWRTATYPKRAFMGPARDTIAPDLPKVFQDMLSK